MIFNDGQRIKKMFATFFNDGQSIKKMFATLKHLVHNISATLKRHAILWALNNRSQKVYDNA